MLNKDVLGPIFSARNIATNFYKQLN